MWWCNFGCVVIVIVMNSLLCERGVVFLLFYVWFIYSIYLVIFSFSGWFVIVFIILVIYESVFILMYF